MFSLKSAQFFLLKVMERRAGELIEKFADENMKKECLLAFEKEMK